MCEHRHLLPWNPFLTVDANAHEDVTCEQGFTVIWYMSSATMSQAQLSSWL